MSFPVLPIPFRKKPQRRCGRCGLYFQRNAQDQQQGCPHCGHLSDAELAELQQRLATQAQASKSLGWLFIAGAAIALVVVLLLLI